MAIDHGRLDPYRRQKSPLQEHVIDEFVAGGLSRRSFVRSATVVGIGLPSLSAILSACSSDAPKSNGASGIGKAGATIRVGQGVPSGAINPLLARASGDIQALFFSGEYLTLVDEDFNVKPWLAESWTPNADGTAWTFKIRQGVKFNDGSPMTVDDVVYNFKQHADSSVGSIAGATFGGVLTPDGVEKIDDTQIRFNLETAVGAWPSYGVSQSNKNVCIVPANYDFSKFEKDFPGTGRFKMVKYTTNVGGTFERNPHYWGTAAKPAKIELSYFADEGALTAAMSAGSVDVNDTFTTSGSPQLLGDNFNIVTAKSSAHSQLSMRCDTGPFTNKLVRQAMALTLNRPEIAAGLFKDYADLGNDSPFAPVFPSTDSSVAQRAQDVAKAKDLLAQAGVPRGFKCTLATHQYAENPQYAQIIKQSAAAIGIDIDVSVMAESVYRGDSTFGKSPWLDSTVSLCAVGDRGVPNFYLSAFLQTIDANAKTGSFNAAHFSNAQYDALSNEFIAAVDVSKQRELAGQIQALLLDESPVIFGYFKELMTAQQKNIDGAYRIPFFPVYWDVTKA